MLQVEIRSFQEEDFKETFISLAEVFKGDGILFGRENAEQSVWREHFIPIFWRPSRVRKASDSIRNGWSSKT